MSVATLRLDFMAWPPTVDPSAAPLLPSTPICVAHAGVTKIGGKRGELLLDIDPLAILAEKRPDGEAIPEVVDARPGVIARPAQTNLAGQPPENTMNILVEQPTAALGDEEVRAAARSKMSVAPFRVVEQSFAGRPMQGSRP
jgi:hypothetical protein